MNNTNNNNNNFNNIVNYNNGGPLGEYKAPTLIGLTNLGSTCYINSVLQCLSQTKILANYFLDNNTKIDEENELAYAFQQLIKTLWDKNYNVVDSCGEKAFEPEKIHCYSYKTWIS